MEFKRKLKKRLFWSLTWGVIGLVLALIWIFSDMENQFLFSFGIAMMVIAVVRTVQYREATKDDKAIRHRELAETDERYLMMNERAKSWALSIYLMLCGLAVIVLSLLGYHDLAMPYAWSVCGLTALYWICWLLVQKKY